MRRLDPGTGIDDAGIADDELVLVASRGELAAIAGAFNEALEAVDDWEFQTRVGVTPDEAEALLDRIGEILRANHEDAEA